MSANPPNPMSRERGTSPTPCSRGVAGSGRVLRRFEIVGSGSVCGSGSFDGLAPVAVVTFYLQCQEKSQDVSQLL